MAVREPGRSSSSPSAREFTVFGRVQGVGFRWFTLRRGRALGVSGWVRNNPDGSVGVRAEGCPSALNALESDLRSGPPGASVTDIRVREAEFSGKFTGFEVAY